MSETASPAGGPPRHSLFDDVQALVTGTLFVSIGVAMFTHAGLLTGGTAGIAFLAHYAFGTPFGAVFFVLNLPFYGLAWLRMGRAFTLKTFVAVVLLWVLTGWVPGWMTFASLSPGFAAVAGGLLMGAGFIILFRHQASLGGLNVLVVWLQQRFGWRAGWVQMAIDAAILGVASIEVEPERLGLSIIGALALNAALAINHRPDRYVAF